MKKGSVFSNSLIYTIVAATQGAIGFFIIPFYTRYLNPNEYGIVSVVQSITSFLAIFYLLALSTAITRYYFDFQEDKKKLKQLIGTIISSITIITIGANIVLFLFHDIIFSNIAKGIDFYPYLLYGLIVVSFYPFITIYQTLLTTRTEGLKYGINTLSVFLLNISLAVIFIVFFNKKADGILLGMLISNGIFFLYSMFMLRKEYILTINTGILKEILRYSLPFVPHLLFSWIMIIVNKLLINNLLSTSLVGIYNVGLTFGMLISMLTISINQAYIPWFFDILKNKPEKKDYIIKFAEFVSMAIALLALTISLYGKEIIAIIFPESYRDAWMVIPFISFAYTFTGLYYFFSSPLFYNKKGTKFIPYATFTSALINIALNMLLIQKYGIIGSAIASMVSMICVAILIFFISKKIEYIPFKAFKMFFYTFGMFFISMVSFLDMDIYSLLLLKTSIILSILVFFFIRYKNDIITFYKMFKPSN